MCLRCDPYITRVCSHSAVTLFVINYTQDGEVAKSGHKNDTKNKKKLPYEKRLENLKFTILWEERENLLI